jgi:TetR/AcrR family transcriptional regulator, fatty acid metabolism regulator protein
MTGHERTKEQLIAAAIDIFDERGFHKSRVSDIVAKAGVAQGTFYIYFKSKEDIFLAICLEFITLFSSALENAEELFAGISYAQVRQNVLTFNRELIELYCTHKKAARILFREGASRSGQVKPVYDRIYTQFIETVGKRLEEHQGRGYVAFEDAETEATFLIGMFDRSLFYFIDVKQNFDIEALSHRMTDFMMGGLTKGRPDGR